MRDSKGRFKSKDLIISLPSATTVFNFIILMFTLLPWLYAVFKFGIFEKIYDFINSIFNDDSKCNCQNFENGNGKY